MPSPTDQEFVTRNAEGVNVLLIELGKADSYLPQLLRDRIAFVRRRTRYGFGPAWHCLARVHKSSR
ncbi:hypothetical protein [Actinocorallia libanotica]|uniref:Uncharacterized protein n=1 Tax=Actinocorallia libanotica TaxID=46162 RepID=A0ABN1QQH4_9ACTN